MSFEPTKHSKPQGSKKPKNKLDISVVNREKANDDGMAGGYVTVCYFRVFTADQ